MSLRKKADLESPHAIFSLQDWEWRVLRVNAPKKGLNTPYATWFIAARSPYTFGSWEYGDTYISEILSVDPHLREATPEFKEYYDE